MTDPNQKFGLDTGVIQKINAVFQKYAEVEGVIVYGSRAKGNYKPGSDIDLTILSKSKDLSLLFKIENEIDDLLLPYKVDLSFFSLIDNQNLIDHISRVGIEFYRRPAK